MSIKHYKMEMRLLTPVIINSGEYFEFGEICLYKGKKEPKWAQLNVTNVIGKMDGNMTFVREATAALNRRDQEGLRKARTRIWKTFEDSDSKKELVVRPCQVLPEAEKTILAKPMQRVDKIMTDPMKIGIAYIPGSSVKGAFRTAMLEAVRSKSDKQPQRWQKGKDFEKDLQAGEDIFEYIKFSDFSFVDSRSDTYIGKINNGTETPIYSAMTTAECFKKNNPEEEVILEGCVSIDDRFWNCKTFKELKMNSEKMCYVVNNYFADACEQENYAKLWRGDEGKKLRKKILDGCNCDWSLLRLGHYIGIQNYTFKIDNPKPPRKNPNPRINIEGGKTLCTIEDINLPPGFCLFKLNED